MRHYRWNVTLALLDVFPDHPWRVWRFSRAPKEFRDDPAAQREFLESVITDHFKDDKENLSALYNLTLEVLTSELGGAFLVVRYGDIHSILKAVFPDHSWDPWKFNVQTLWDPTRGNQAELLSFTQHLSSRLGLSGSDLSDWYRVSWNQLGAAGGLTIVKQCGGLQALLSAAYPDHRWEAEKFGQSLKRSQQQLLKNLLGDMFPGHGTVLCLAMQPGLIAMPMQKFARRTKYQPQRFTQAVTPLSLMCLLALSSLDLNTKASNISATFARLISWITALHQTQRNTPLAYVKVSRWWKCPIGGMEVETAFTIPFTNSGQTCFPLQSVRHSRSQRQIRRKAKEKGSQEDQLAAPCERNRSSSQIREGHVSHPTRGSQAPDARPACQTWLEMRRKHHKHRIAL